MVALLNVYHRKLVVLVLILSQETSKQTCIISCCLPLWGGVAMQVIVVMEITAHKLVLLRALKILAVVIEQGHSAFMSS